MVMIQKVFEEAEIHVMNLMSCSVAGGAGLLDEQSGIAVVNDASLFLLLLSLR